MIVLVQWFELSIVVFEYFEEYGYAKRWLEPRACSKPKGQAHSEFSLNIRDSESWFEHTYWNQDFPISPLSLFMLMANPWAVVSLYPCRQVALLQRPGMDGTGKDMKNIFTGTGSFERCWSPWKYNKDDVFSLEVTSNHVIQIVSLLSWPGGSRWGLEDVWECFSLGHLGAMFKFRRRTGLRYWWENVGHTITNG